MKNLKFSVLLLLLTVFLFSCEKDNTDENTDNDTALGSITFNPNLTYGTMTDQEGNVYKTITIGTQTWMAENLRTTKYSDGTDIPNVSGNTEWSGLTIGAFCNYNNTINSDSIATFGRLYNWYAVNTGKLAPAGWHVPSEAEWATLQSYLGGDLAGGKLKETGTTHWNSPNTGATNESGFTALPAGCRTDSGGSFQGMNDFGNWWGATEYSTDASMLYTIFNNGSNLDISNGSKFLGISVRCIKN